MIGYLQKFNNLQQDLKAKVSSPNIMRIIDELEKQYDVNLATVIMKVMVKEIEIEDLPQFFVFEYKFDNTKANDLVDDLKKRVFFQFSGYLGIQAETQEKDFGVKEEDSKTEEWMEKRKQDMATRTSDFFFSPEDEEEIKNLTQKLSTPKEEKKDKSSDKLESIIKELNLNFSSENLKTRFEKILETYLRGVRIRVDVKHTLMKSIGIGGMGMTEEEADNILQIAEKYQADKDAKNMRPLPKIRLVEDRPLDISEIPEEDPFAQEEIPEKENKNKSLEDIQLRDVDYDFSKLATQDDNKIEKKKEQEIKLLDDGDDMLLEEGHKDPVSFQNIETLEQKSIQPSEQTKIQVLEKPKTENPKEEIKIQEPEEDKKSEPMIEKSSINMAESRKMAKSDGKIRMEDVKYVPKILGPIDELREMDLVNFRRLSNNPDEAAEKIKEKLGFLEEENYRQRVAGIKAWRESPINKLYLAIGQESIVHNKSVEAVISEKQSQGNDYLTNQEFEAIMNLNKSLRF